MAASRNCGLTLPPPPPVKPVAAPTLGGAAFVSLVTCNLNGFNRHDDAPAAPLGKQLPSCAFFQETKLENQDHFNTVRRHIANHVGRGNFQLYVNDHRTTLHGPHPHRSNGVAMFFHSTMPGFASLRHLWSLRVPDRYMVVRADWDGTPVYFHNVYAPVIHSERASFFSSLPREFELNSRHFVGGDFNLPMGATLDSAHFHPNHHAGKNECCEWLSTLRVVDAWRTKEPDSKILSGPRGRNRIDYIFADTDTVAHFHESSSFARNAYHGDHMTHTTTFASAPSRGATPNRSRLWRLPRELLRDPNIVTAIQVEAARLLDEMVGSPTCNVGAKWSGWLRRMKKQLRQAQYNSQRLHMESLCVLQARRTRARTDHRAGLINNAAVEAAESAYTSAQSQLQQYHLDKGFDHHSTMNEKPTAHFLRKPPALKIPIARASKDGTVFDNPADVARVFTEYWSGIMVQPPGQEPHDPLVYQDVLNHISNRLSADQHDELDRPLEAAELRAALETMKCNRSPSADAFGFPVEFFLLAPAVFSEILVRVFNRQLDHHRSLLPHQRRSAVTLLYKKGDRAMPGNYRPITLMPVEVKILSRTLAYRLSNVATTLIHPTQAGFVQGRRMSDHIHLIQALQHRATRENAEHYATFLDFAKAYDRVDHGFLFDVLGKMNIGTNFLAWVKLLYTAPSVHLLLSNALGPAIQPNRGTKQGCPLSCLLFDLYLEPLGGLLRAAPQLGIPLPDGSTLTSVFFADDTTLLSNSLESAEFQVDEIFGKFCSVSGAALNLDKCVTLVLNDAELPTLRRGTPSLRLAQSGTPVRYLGAFFGHKLDATYHARLVHDKFLAAFPRWKCRARTLHGRRTIASSMILSQIWHITAVVPLPAATIAFWQRLTTNYILGGRTSDDPSYRPLIHRMWHHDKRIGLGITHIASSIRYQRLLLLQRLMTAHTSISPPPWACLVQQQFAHCLQQLYRPSHPFDFLWQSPHALSSWIYTQELHPLWLDVWTEWARVPLAKRMAIPPDFAMILELPLWDTTFPLFHDDNNRSAGRMATQRSSTRSWCLHGARNDLRCLRDFLLVGGDCSWPSFSEFLGHMSSGNPSVPVVLRNGSIQFAPVEKSRMIYDHLSQVLHKAQTLHSIPPGARCPLPPSPRHVFRALVRDVPFHLWPKALIKTIASHAPLPTRDHPMTSAARPDFKSVGLYLRMARQSMGVLSPVHADVWFRVLFGMLPVNSRFAFRQARDPRAVQCAHGCPDVESPCHALYACPHLLPLWQYHQLAWRNTGARFTWHTILNLDEFYVRPRLRYLETALFQLWVMVTGVCVHLAWFYHNQVQYQHRALPPARALIESSFVTWMATLRSWLRRLPPTDDHRHALVAAAEMLLRQPGYAALYRKYPRCLDLCPTFDVH